MDFSQGWCFGGSPLELLRQKEHPGEASWCAREGSSSSSHCPSSSPQYAHITCTVLTQYRGTSLIRIRAPPRTAIGPYAHAYCRVLVVVRERGVVVLLPLPQLQPAVRAHHLSGA